MTRKCYLSVIVCFHHAKFVHFSYSEWYSAFHFTILNFREGFLGYHVISLKESHFCTILNKNRTIDFGLLKAPLGFGLKVTWSNNKVGTIGEHVQNRKLLISEHLVINKRLPCDLTSLISTPFTLFRPYQTPISDFKFRPCKNDTRGYTWFL